ncbi:MAG: hypothetical protein UY12_C0026G0015 [Parcubacteria group bacterium GW2011_GWA2_47_8b]|uniref:TadE family protein n=3 Tax=Parcubacteria group TaxID=1794811 RepID=A0A0G1T6H8_9BACT|nr:MAG: hypothetical protein UY02_C0002G0019 [Candidatus Giovannonibacteria bacterium GW2011_GWB1_47_6b]KKU83946.1 MAG: hypothetical protein UY12_C0026G0015 [Parcubacteria group bacterium GW2011_GWA2_47_8b]KKU94893.1 MAG: hypothetical protein UY24_C0007G0020 [Parcubacteria group bacterium GW2011_GWA1_48_11b]
MMLLLTTALKMRLKGISSLPTMLLLGGIIIEIAIAIAFLTYYFNVSNFAARLSAEALAAARAGIDDATIKVVLNKNCPDSSCPSPYTLALGDRAVTVTICKDTCAGVGKHQVTAVGSAFAIRRQMVAILEVDPVTGEVKVESLKETAL